MKLERLEPVRLVVWDLDNTFWQGILTEGGITFLPQHRQIVIELARRGIMSSICSKNDFEAVRDLLKEYRVWDYFVFPSINWESKGPRLKALIETAQLRPETVMLIDDNPMNRNEALFFVPGLRVADETITGGLLSDPLFRGKRDGKLRRLKQYKLLETRRAEMAAAGGDNIEFLRSSNIRVSIQHNVEPQLDRVVELINRTNQLNFTKRRLPEDASGHTEIARLLSMPDVQAGLVRVRDKYGDYGDIGFYAFRVFENGKKRLLHYCFSCRTLNMGIEEFVYQLIGRPELTIVGEVLSDPTTAETVDWIELDDGDDHGGENIPRARRPMFLRGGCDLALLEHYGRSASFEVQGEYNIVRNGIGLRLDHSLAVRYAIEGLPRGVDEAIYGLGYAPEDFRSAVFSDPRAGCWVLSLIPDQWVALYRHRHTGALIPFFAAAANGLANVCEFSEAQRREVSDNPHMHRAMDILAREFVYVGPTPEEIFKDNLRTILNNIPTGSDVFLVMNKEYHGDSDVPAARALPAIRLNQWTREIAGQFENVHPLLVTDFIAGPSEIYDGVHFRRMVYYRMFDHIRKTVSRI